MLIQLAIMGLLAALLPLAIVWVSSDTNKYRKLIWVTAFLTFDLIMFGAFTRLTDSGLGCPDWPGCYGHANPGQAHEHISAAEAAMPHGPVTVMKAWIEMIHRYLAMGVGVLIVSMMVIAWRMWLQSRRQDAAFSPWLPTFCSALSACKVRLVHGPSLRNCSRSSSLSIYYSGWACSLCWFCLERERINMRRSRHRHWHCECRQCLRWRSCSFRLHWADGSVPTMRHWPASISLYAMAMYCRKWTSVMDSHSGAILAKRPMANTCHSLH
jgi:hypothetical protein